MFARVKKSGKYRYLQIVENNKVKGRKHGVSSSQALRLLFDGKLPDFVADK